VIGWIKAKYQAWLARRARQRLRIVIGRPPSDDASDRTIRMHKDIQSRQGSRENQ
jgi:hypothetical protein